MLSNYSDGISFSIGCDSRKWLNMEHKFDDGSAAQEKVMAYYRNYRFVNSKEEEDALHMAFSPFRVPKDLTKIQVRRKVNHYLKIGQFQPFALPISNRLEILINGKMMVGASFIGKSPENSKQLKKLVFELFDFKKVKKRVKL